MSDPKPKLKDQRPKPVYDCKHCDDTGLIPNSHDLKLVRSRLSADPWSAWLPCECEVGRAMGSELTALRDDPEFGSEAWIQKRRHQAPDDKSEAGRAKLEAAAARAERRRLIEEAAKDKDLPVV